MLDTSNVQAVRVSRDGKSAILKTPEGLFQAVSAVDGQALSPAVTTLSELSDGNSWRRVAVAESEALVASLSQPDVVVDDVAELSYRVPDAVRTEISKALESSQTQLSAADLVYATALAYDETVGLPAVKWMSDFFDEYDTPQRLRGGFKGQKWASKIVAPSIDEEPEDLAPLHDFYSDKYDYFGIGDDPYDTASMRDLIAVDFETHEVFIWDGQGFDLTMVPLEDIDEPQLIPLDDETASHLAAKLTEDPIGPHNILDFNPEERSLYGMAESELDYEDMERRGSIIADASGYTPAERSLNARRQIRGPGGTFGGRQIEQGTELLAFKKAKLSDGPPLVEDVAARIKQFIEDAIATDETAAEPATAPVTAGAAPNPPAPAAEGAPAAPVDSNATAGAPTGGPSGAAIYFAIVDKTDTTAVLEAIAIVKDSTGNPQAWVRTKGAWKNDPATLAKLTGSTPPPVIELTAPEPAKTVLAQVDKYDNSEGKFPAVAVPEKAPVTAAGFVVPGTELGIYDEKDIVDAVSTFDTLDPQVQPDAKRIIRNRAIALNRKDLIPADWRTLSHVEEGEALASQSPLFSEFGDVIVASAHGGHGMGGAKGAERLKQYWTHGAGAAKIRWGTGGDLTRAHKHLAKYVGPLMAWGLAQNYHKSLFGMTNARRDKRG
jgi:hypothetical protein